MFEGRHLDFHGALGRNSAGGGSDGELLRRRQHRAARVTDVAVHKTVAQAVAGAPTDTAVRGHTQVESHGNERGVHKPAVASVHEALAKKQEHKVK